MTLLVLADHDQRHRCVGARAHGRNRVRPRVVHRLRLADGVAIPRRTRQRAKTIKRPSSRPSPPPVEPSSSARRPSPWPCPDFWCSPLYFLRSTALTASAVVVLSALSAIVVLPALLALLGKRIDSLAVIRRKVPLSADSVFWRRCAEAVTRRPLLCALPVIAVLLVLGIPFLSVQLAMPDERALPSDSNARLVAESLRNDYPVDTSQAVTLLARNDADALDDLAAPVSRDGRCGPGRLRPSARTSAASPSPDRRPRPNIPVPPTVRVPVGQPRSRTPLNSSSAPSARRSPTTKSRSAVRPPRSSTPAPPSATGFRWRFVLIALATFVLLFLFTGSIVVPIKALVLNLLVLSAVLGTMVWIFQDGHLASMLGVTPAPLNLSMVVLLCCIAFSLSVDYEIFLLSRIKEARDSGLSNNDAIVVGLGRVGRIISSAALLLTITLFSFANGLSFMKMFGIGTALAIVIDATVIRGVVVPAFLRVAGDLNWWAPRPLKWLHARIGFSEAPPAAPITPKPVCDTPTSPRTAPPCAARRRGTRGRGHPRPAPRGQCQRHGHRRRSPRAGAAVAEICCRKAFIGAGRDRAPHRSSTTCQRCFADDEERGSGDFGIVMPTPPASMCTCAARSRSRSIPVRGRPCCMAPRCYRCTDPCRCRRRAQP